MREIGSEFWDAPISEHENGIFPKNTKWFLSGRHSLEYIVIDSGIKSISMPRWCCDSMLSPFRKRDVKIEFYDNQPNYYLDAVFVMDYFGFGSSASLLVPASYKGIIIRDVTHSLFSKNYTDADYYFGSFRKWVGIATGGFAWGRWRKNKDIPQFDSRYVQLRLKAFDSKNQYIDGSIDDKTFLDIYKEANDSLDDIPACLAYPEDIELARHVDAGFIRKTRRRNAKFLIDELGLPLILEDDMVPLFVPIFIDDRDELRSYLIKNKVYCPVHWPNHDVNGTELSLVCDQRYDLEDMKRIVMLIKDFKRV